MRAVADAFDLGQIHAVSPVMRGAMGEISKVETDQGTYAVKELFSWNPGDGAEAEAGLTRAARHLGLVAPKEVRARTGELVTAVEGVRYRVHEWLELDHDAPRPADAVGTSLATLHRHARPDDRPLEPWYEVPPAPARWEHIVRSAADRKSWAAPLEALLPHLLDLGSLRRRSQPRVTCHRDLVADNVIPLRDGRLALLDWENAGPLEPEQELGYVLLWCPDAYVAYADQLGTAPLLSAELYATGVCTWLNFLAVQAEAALNSQASEPDRLFADRCVEAAVTQPLQIP